MRRPILFRLMPDALIVTRCSIRRQIAQGSQPATVIRNAPFVPLAGRDQAFSVEVSHPFTRLGGPTTLTNL